MHIFLQGPRGIGKSTVIRKTIELLTERRNITIGGFYTWNGGKDDPNIYMRPARSGNSSGQFRVAAYSESKRSMVGDTKAFDTLGTGILLDSAGADLIIMDELGFLESGAGLFKKTVLETIAGGVQALGVLRLGDVPWHEAIKNDSRVSIYEVNEKTRDTLPQTVAIALRKP